MTSDLIIKNETIIYVACPANIATGGPELLQQLVFELRKIGLNANIYYYSYKNQNPVHEAYIKYNNPYTTKIIDSLDNILIVPEVKTNLLFEYKNVQKVIWWLSIDNYYNAFNHKNGIKRFLKNISYKIGLKKIYKFNTHCNIKHFVQSEYAKQHLYAKGVSNIHFLGDYLNDVFIKNQLSKHQTIKKDIVVYNPQKGVEFTQKIISSESSISFIPIQNMTREQVSDLLSQAKVYIDFGNHPGKDRIPREAAISGCCIITNRMGSANYYQDVPIDDEFKFNNHIDDIGNIIKKIQDCLDNYEQYTVRFESYRTMIVGEQEQFIKDIKKIFFIDKSKVY